MVSELAGDEISDLEKLAKRDDLECSKWALMMLGAYAKHRDDYVLPTRLSERLNNPMRNDQVPIKITEEEGSGASNQKNTNGGIQW